MTKISLRFLPQQTLAEAEALLADRVESGAPVLDERGMFLGVVTHVDIEHVPPDKRDQHTVAETMNRDVLTIYPDETLDEALEQLTSRRVSWAPIVDAEAMTEGKHVIGLRNSHLFTFLILFLC
jgi:chloride channel protein, CIC family